MLAFIEYNLLNIYSLIVLIFLLLQVFVNLKNNGNSSGRLWIGIIVMTIIIQLLDIISWAYIFDNSSEMLLISYISNSVLYLVLNFLTLYMAQFIEFSVEFSNKNKPLLYKIFIPFIVINEILIILNFIFGFYFKYYDGQYIRGGLNIVFFILVFMPLVFTGLRVIVKYKESRQLRSLLVLGIFFPMVCSLLHLANILPVPVLFPSLTISIFIFNSLMINNSLCVDFLTELQNKRGINRYFANLPPFLTGYLAVIYIDINNFKKINDSFGHDEGDYALRVFSKIIMRPSKNSDLIARAGGDEFLIVTVLNKENEISGIMGKYLSELKTYNEMSKKPYKLEMSYGISVLKPNGKIDKDALIEEADRRMYNNKNRDKNAIKN